MSGAWGYLDGALVPAAEAKVAAEDAGLLYGRGVFETFRARRGRVFRLEQHYERLQAGAAEVGVAVALSMVELEAAVRQLTERCGIDDARVRLTLTAGPAGGADGPVRGAPAVVMQARPATEYGEELYERGMRAKVASVRRNDTSPLSRVKSLNCLDNLLAREEAQREGFDEALLLNTRGSVAEASARSVFAVRGREVVTPPIEDGALPGVTRAAVLELARGAGLAAREASLTLDELLTADEAFLTSAIVGVMPLVCVDAMMIGSGVPGEVTRRLRALYEAAAAG